MKELLTTQTIQKGEHVCAIACGPGLTMEAAFLKGV
jgi:predicted naringenin-chalcone synthase